MSQITEQCKLMVVLMDATGIRIPHFNKNDAWLVSFEINAERLFEKEKPWVRDGKKNLSKVVKSMLHYLIKRNDGEKSDFNLFGAGELIKKEAIVNYILVQEIGTKIVTQLVE